MKKMLKSFGLVFVLACAAFGAQAEDFRVGVINTDRVFKAVSYTHLTLPTNREV